MLFNIIKPIKKGDYVYALVPDHPNATKSGYVLMHRVVMENHLNRLLDKDEIIHHKDENKKNNDISNLEITDIASHARLHNYKGRKFKAKCSYCEEWFECPCNQRPEIKGQKLKFCSRSCNGKYYHSNGFHFSKKTKINKNLILDI